MGQYLISSLLLYCVCYAVHETTAEVRRNWHTKDYTYQPSTYAPNGNHSTRRWWSTSDSLWQWWRTTPPPWRTTTQELRRNRWTAEYTYQPRTHEPTGYYSTRRWWSTSDNWWQRWSTTPRPWRTTTQVDRCYRTSMYCMNGGYCTTNCYNTYPYDYVCCRCPSYYSGRYCEKRIYTCDSNPCLNGGTCTDDGKSFTCTCSRYYTGTVCQNLRTDDLEPRADLQRLQLVNFERIQIGGNPPKNDSSAFTYILNLIAKLKKPTS